MPEQKDFAKVRCWIDGDFAIQLLSVSLRTDAGNIPVNLMNEGLAGFTDGSGSQSISITYAIPRSGMEFNFQRACVERGYHSIQISVAGQAGVFRGKFSDNEISQSADSATQGTVNFVGEFTALK